jgi:hypothetical protein
VTRLRQLLRKIHGYLKPPRQEAPAIAPRLKDGPRESSARPAATDVAGTIVWDARSPSVLEYLRTRCGKLAEDIDAATKERIFEVLARMYEEKATFAEMQKAIRGLSPAFTRARANSIATYVMGNAFSAGTLAFARDAKGKGLEIEKAWMAEDDACPICQENADMGWIPLDKNFPSGDDGPLAHEGCRCCLLTRTFHENNAPGRVRPRRSRAVDGRADKEA